MALAEGRPYEDLICAYSWDCAKAYRVMLCESTADPQAYAAGNYGLFQISSIHAGMVSGNLDALYIPEVNVSVAYSLFQSSGWQPWAYCGQR